MARQGTPRRRYHGDGPAAGRLTGGRISPKELRQLAVDCMLDAGCCEEPDLCPHAENRMTPLEFVDWVLARLGPAPWPPPGGLLTEAGRARIVAAQARRRRREGRRLEQSAA